MPLASGAQGLLSLPLSLQQVDPTRGTAQPLILSMGAVLPILFRPELLLSLTRVMLLAFLTSLA